MALHLTDDEQNDLVDQFNQLTEGFEKLGDILHQLYREADGGSNAWHGVRVARKYQTIAEDCEDQYAPD